MTKGVKPLTYKFPFRCDEHEEKHFLNFYLNNNIIYRHISNYDDYSVILWWPKDKYDVNFINVCETLYSGPELEYNEIEDIIYHHWTTNKELL